MFEKLLHTIENINFKDISEERRLILQPLIDYIQIKVASSENVNLNFICTHNSRRSHLSQIWAQTMASYYAIPNVSCFSGGTEATALFPKVVETLEIQGFQFQIISKSKNPVYAIKFSENCHPIICFSKTFDDNFNPKSNFAAIMTCSSADEGCPFIVGAEKRFPIRYNDPKQYDGSNLMNEKYLERSTEIATEMSYLFSKIKYGK